MHRTLVVMINLVDAIGNVSPIWVVDRDARPEV